MFVLMSENRTRVCVDTNSFNIFNFAWGTLKTRVYLPPEFCLIEDLEVYSFGGTILVIFEYYWMTNYLPGIFTCFQCSLNFARSKAWEYDDLLR